MSRDRGLINERNTAIKAKYNELASKTIKDDKGRDIALYRHKAILVMVARKFYLSPVTVENIMSAPEEVLNQIELFPEE